MKNRTLILALGVALAVVIAVPATGGSPASKSRAGGAPEQPVATTAASAKRLAKKAQKTAKKAFRKARAAERAAKAAQASADSAQTTADEAGAAALAAQESADLAQQTANGKLPLNGPYRLSLPPSLFVADDPGSASVEYATGRAILSGGIGAAADVGFRAPIVVPVDLLGQRPRLDSFEVCYNAEPANATIDSLSVVRTTPTDGNLPPVASSPISDGTDRADRRCVALPAATVPTLGPNDVLEALVTVDFSATSTVDIYRVTVNFSL